MFSRGDKTASQWRGVRRELFRWAAKRRFQLVWKNGVTVDKFLRNRNVCASPNSKWSGSVLQTSINIFLQGKITQVILSLSLYFTNPVDLFHFAFIPIILLRNLNRLVPDDEFKQNRYLPWRLHLLRTTANTEFQYFLIQTKANWPLMDLSCSRNHPPQSQHAKYNQTKCI